MNLKACPALIAALPREVSGLVKGWEGGQTAGKVWVWTKGDAVVACAGMGASRAALAVQAAMEAMPVTALISVGLAGACDPGLKVGEIVRVGVVIEESTGEKSEAVQSSPNTQVLVSMDAIASVREKARLRSLYGAAAVDMEAATVARLARVRGLEFGAIKAISDEAEFELEGLSQFATADGQFREGVFALHAALRPAMWGKVLSLGRNSSKAVAALTEALRSELDWYERQG